jgi:hypothetical protein
MSQVNVNPGGGPYRDDGAAAGMSMMAVVLVLAVIIILAVLAWGAFAAHWFGPITSNTSTTTVTTSAPARAPATSAAPAGGTGPTISAPALPSR